MNDKIIHQNSNLFKENFNTKPLLVFSPGRINIIGEHTDYNNGFVLPAAINKGIYFAVAKNTTSQCTIMAKDLNDQIQFDIRDKIRPSKKLWVNYLLGILHQMKEKEMPIQGFNCIFSGDIPIGSGLSSSAALECGFAYALNEIFKLGLNQLEIVKMGQRAEHEYVGVKCGIMDQFANMYGKEKKVIKLDCRSLNHSYHNADFKEYSIVLLDSKVKHSLASSAYNRRRQECEEGVSIVQQQYPTVRSLRDCNEQQIIEMKSKMTKEVFKRCHYVVKEIARVEQACDALNKNDLKRLGALMFETHKGLSEEYEVSCKELDFLIHAVKEEKSVIGARLMGGGFGGCTINLVKKGTEEKIIRNISEQYGKKFKSSGAGMASYFVKISNGTSLII